MAFFHLALLHVGARASRGRAVRARVAALQLAGRRRHASADGAYSKRVEDLLASMTIEEKVGQLTLLSSDHATPAPMPPPGSATPSSAARWAASSTSARSPTRARCSGPRWSRPGWAFPCCSARDVLHGYRTIFPIPLGQAASFDLAAIRDADRIAAREAAAAGINWVFSPMLDVARDPRWGRIAEGNGESAWLGARIAAARISGLQGDRLDADDSVAACAKHLGANSAVEGGRDYSAVELSERAMREVLSAAFPGRGRQRGGLLHGRVQHLCRRARRRQCRVS